MPGYSTGAPQASRHHKHHSPRADKYTQAPTIFRENKTSHDSYKDAYKQHHHNDRSRYSETKHGRKAPPRSGAGRGSETIGFIPGSADNTPTNRHACGSCASVGWSGCKALICCVLTCGFYGSREPCLPVNESSTDNPPKASIESHPPNGMAVTKSPGGGISFEPNKSTKSVKLLPTSDSFRYPDVRIAGQSVRYPVMASKRTRTSGRGESQRPISNTSLLSREDYDLDDRSDTGTDIDSLITKKLLELYALHQIDQLAKCTSDSSFSRKTNEISELIYSIAQDYNLEEQEAECKLVHGVIRISTRKGKRNKRHHSAGQRPNGRSDGTLPDSGNETMTNTFMSSDFPEVKVSEQTPSDELARKMRQYSGRSALCNTCFLSAPTSTFLFYLYEVSDDKQFPYKTRFEQRHRVSATEHFTLSDLKTLSELNPPAVMQNGNVGTSVKVFLQLIQSCRLPPRLIRKLGLTFPKTGSNRRYGNVPFQYQDTCTLPATEETVLTAAGHEISGPGALAARTSARRWHDDPCETAETDEPHTEEEEEDVQSNADDDEDCCEEWERHEALHDDVTSQERSKERLFEEEIELKWEKGGSGLVFYTDAQYWQEEEGDFDEQTADDWDVDMSIYYDKDGGDMDARDYVQMRLEKRLRDGLEDGSGHNQAIGSFERFTKGFGRRVMEKQGWKDGEGLGSSQAGMPDALENEGKHPHCKRGFGYHGEKLLLHPGKKARKDFHITTIYDQPKDIDKGDSLLRRQTNTSMKYRGWQPGGSVGPRR